MTLAKSPASPVHWAKHPAAVLYDVFAAPHPGPLLQVAAQVALEETDKGKTPEGSVVDRLARALLEWFRPILAAEPFCQVEPLAAANQLETDDAEKLAFAEDDYAATESLVNALREDGRAELVRTAGLIDKKLQQRRMSQERLPETGKRERWENWKRWLDEAQEQLPDGTYVPHSSAMGRTWVAPGRLIISVARALYHDAILPSLPIPLVFMATRDKRGDITATIDKRAAATAWGWGSAGTEVDGERYVAPPTALVPHVDLLPDDVREKVRQLYLPLVLDDSAVAPDAGAVLSVPAAKVLLLALASNARQAANPIVELSLQELAELIHGGNGRLQARDLARAADAVREASKLQVVYQDGTCTRCLDARYPTPGMPVTGTMQVGWALGAFFKRDLAELGHLRGSFVTNISGALRLPNRGQHLRVYVLACAEWNRAFNPATGRFDAQATPARSLDEIAQRYFALSPRAYDYLVATKGRRAVADRQHHHQQLKALSESLQRLEGVGLVRLDGTRKALAIRPPEQLLEAKEKLRRSGPREIKPGE